MRHVAHTQAYKIEASELAVDLNVEHSEVAHPSSVLQMDADDLDDLGLERIKIVVVRFIQPNALCVGIFVLANVVVALRIERNRVDPRPFACPTWPARWIALAGPGGTPDHTHAARTAQAPSGAACLGR